MPQIIFTDKNLGSELADLTREIRLLRSLFISVVDKNKKGIYRPKFIKEILKAAQEKPEYIFKDVKSFLSEFRRQ